MREMLPNVRMRPLDRFFGMRLLVVLPAGTLLLISNPATFWPKPNLKTLPA